MNDNEGGLCGKSNLNFCERQAFLLGSKVDTWLKGTTPISDYLLMLAALRQRVGWWQRGMVYQACHNCVPSIAHGIAVHW